MEAGGSGFLTMKGAAMADEIDTADHVHHAPSGEDWVVAYVRGDRLAWCGWPSDGRKTTGCARASGCGPLARTS